MLEDLRIHAASLGIADRAQVVFVLGSEMQCGDVVEQQAQRASASGMSEALGSDGVAIPVGLDPGEVTLNDFVGHDFCTQIGEYAQPVRLLVGSTIRAIIRSRDTASAMPSKPTPSWMPPMTRRAAANWSPRCARVSLPHPRGHPPATSRCRGANRRISDALRARRDLEIQDILITGGDPACRLKQHPMAFSRSPEHGLFSPRPHPGGYAPRTSRPSSQPALVVGRPFDLGRDLPRSLPATTHGSLSGWSRGLGSHARSIRRETQPIDAPTTRCHRETSGRAATCGLPGTGIHAHAADYALAVPPWCQKFFGSAYAVGHALSAGSEDYGFGVDQHPVVTPSSTASLGRVSQAYLRLVS